MKDVALIEGQFVSDYSEFAMRMNFNAVTALLEKARTISDHIEQKSICLSGLQFRYVFTGSTGLINILLQLKRTGLGTWVARGEIT